jgi:hypothetical protein
LTANRSVLASKDWSLQRTQGASSLRAVRDRPWPQSVTCISGYEVDESGLADRTRCHFGLDEFDAIQRL